MFLGKLFYSSDQCMKAFCSRIQAYACPDLKYLSFLFDIGV